MKSAKIKKDKSTPEKAEFWSSVEKAAQEVSSWPAWKRAYLPPTLSESSNKRDENLAAPKFKKK